MKPTQELDERRILNIRTKDFDSIIATEDFIPVGSTGEYATIHSIGDGIKVGSTGPSARVISTGFDAEIAALGKNAIVVALGEDTKKIVIGEGGMCAVMYRNERGAPRIAVGYAYEHLLPGVPYKVNTKGEFEYFYQACTCCGGPLLHVVGEHYVTSAVGIPGVEQLQCLNCSHQVLPTF